MYGRKDGWRDLIPESCLRVDVMMSLWLFALSCEPVHTHVSFEISLSYFSWEKGWWVLVAIEGDGIDVKDW